MKTGGALATAAAAQAAMAGGLLLGVLSGLLLGMSHGDRRYIATIIFKRLLNTPQTTIIYSRKISEFVQREKVPAKSKLLNSLVYTFSAS